MLQGGLFARDWLVEGVTETPAWRALDDEAVTAARATIGQLLTDLTARKNPNESETEAKLVWPVLAALSWEHVSVQQNMTVKGRKDVPDALLFASAQADAAAREDADLSYAADIGIFSKPVSRSTRGASSGEDGGRRCLRCAGYDGER